MRRDIVFVHIPKTAGTSLRNALERTLSNHLILRDYADVPETTPELYQLVYVDRQPSRIREVFGGGSRGILLSGHFPAQRYWDFFDAESFITFLRHPVDRVISEYNHFREQEGWTLDIQEFVQMSRFRNVISRMLADVDVDRLGFVGFMEQLEITVPALGRFLGAEIFLGRVNVGKYRQAGMDTASDLREMIAELNSEDMQLYERLLRTRGNAPCAVQNCATPAESYVGRVKLKDGRLVGWLCNTACELIAEVEILQGTRLLARMPADKFREKIKSKGLSRTGMCGFQFELSSFGSGWSPEEEIIVRAAESEYELRGSPIRCLRYRPHPRACRQ